VLKKMSCSSGFYFRFLLVNAIYHSTILSSIYKIFKWFRRQRTGTTELYRSCNKVIIDKSEITPFVLYRIDLCLLYSSKLLVERRGLEATKQNPLDSFIVSISKKKGFIKGTPQELVLEKCLSKYYNLFKLLNYIDDRAGTKYDPTDDTHEQKLLDLWSFLMPHQSLKSRISEQWKDIGFQGTNPATDFRGMGMLGLDGLHYFAKSYPLKCRDVLLRSHHPKYWFSFAIVGINITQYAIQLCRTRALNVYFYTNGTEKDSFHEFYCYLFTSFGQFWTEAFSNDGSLTVMDFKKIFSKFKIKIQRQLLEMNAMRIENTMEESKTFFSEEEIGLNIRLPEKSVLISGDPSNPSSSSTLRSDAKLTHIARRKNTI